MILIAKTYLCLLQQQKCEPLSMLSAVSPAHNCVLLISRQLWTSGPNVCFSLHSTALSSFYDTGEFYADLTECGSADRHQGIPKQGAFSQIT